MHTSQSRIFFLIRNFYKIEAHLDSLINEQAYHILAKTDLLDAYKIIQNHDTKIRGPLVNVLGMDSNTLKSAMVRINLKLFENKQTLHKI